jgi:hypothetical protein
MVNTNTLSSLVDANCDSCAPSIRQPSNPKRARSDRYVPYLTPEAVWHRARAGIVADVPLRLQHCFSRYVESRRILIKWLALISFCAVDSRPYCCRFVDQRDGYSVASSSDSCTTQFPWTGEVALSWVTRQLEAKTEARSTTRRFQRVPEPASHSTQHCASRHVRQTHLS